MDTPWNGFHHIALVTPDLDATIHFYRNALGMQIGEILPATPQRGRHCFIKPGDTETWGLHYFEYPQANLLAEPEMLAERFHFINGVLQHIAFALPDEEAALVLRERLKNFDVQMSEVNTIGRLRNFMFTDNNGLFLEAAWPQAS
ncbi:MAG: VOC family protein [Anaerolineae bacterium]|nr:VOC family protein [Anaerolineae bacterium]